MALHSVLFDSFFSLNSHIYIIEFLNTHACKSTFTFSVYVLIHL